MRSERFFKHHLLPFAEVRHSTGSGASFKPHMHKGVSIGAVESGEIAYHVQGCQTILLGPGSLTLVNPEVLHSCNPAGDGGRSYYMLYLDADWCFRVQQAVWHVDQLVQMDLEWIDDRVLYDHFRKTMEQLMDDRVHLQEKEQSLFDLVSEVFMKSCSPQREKEPLPGDIEKLKRLLSGNLDEDLPLNSLAHLLASNPYSLIRRFKAQTGITPHAYRMNCRIELAKQYLREGRDIGDVALDCGFFDQSHLHRHFKAMTTITPQEYKVNFVQ